MSLKLNGASSFASFELTAQQELEGFTFNELNIAVIQNLISDAAEELLEIRLDGKLRTVEEETKLAFTSGQISILKFLLTNAQVLKETIAHQQAQQSQQFNQNSQEGN